MLVANGQISFAPAFAELHKQCFKEPWSIKEIETLLKLPTAVNWITEHSFLMCSKVLDEMEILSIGVLPNFRKKHAASMLMKELITYAENLNITKIFLEVNIENIAAQRLYKKFGFTQTGTRPGYYKTSDGFQDALCYTKELKRIEIR